MSVKPMVGLDMGGTKMLAVVLDENHKELSRAKTRTPVGAGNNHTMRELVHLVREAVDKAELGLSDIEALGIAAPGPIDVDRGHVISMPNVAMHDYPLRDKLREQLSLPVVLANDVNAGTYGEFVSGAGKGQRNVIGIFPGTGVGGGIVVDGALYGGRHGKAGEFGHMIVQAGGRRCGCGKYGCLEAVSSKTAIAKELVHLAMTGQAPTVLELAGTDISRVKSGVIKKAISAGERAVREVVERAAWFLGLGIGSLVDIFDPDVVIVGGGLAEKLGTQYLEWVQASMKDHSMIGSDVKLKLAELGDDSVVIGAAVLAAEAQHG